MSSSEFTSPYGSGVAFGQARVCEGVPRLLAEEEAFFKGSMPKRQRELMLGRAAARQALRILGHSDELPLLSEEGTRIPLWPLGLVGSLSHKEDRAVALLAEADAARGVGVDLEQYSNEQRILTHKVASQNEAKWITAVPELEAYRSLLVFSAKETLYKALYPLLRMPLAFRDAELELESESTFKGTLSERIRERLPFLTTLTVYYFRRADLVLTMCVIPR